MEEGADLWLKEERTGCLLLRFCWLEKEKKWGQDWKSEGDAESGVVLVRSWLRLSVSEGESAQREAVAEGSCSGFLLEEKEVVTGRFRRERRTDRGGRASCSGRVCGWFL